MIQSDDYLLLQKHLEDDFFFLYLMMTSRKILKYCLLGYKQKIYINSSSINFDSTITFIDESIRNWENIRNLVIKHIVKSMDNLKIQLDSLLEEIILGEDRLFENLSLLKL